MSCNRDMASWDAKDTYAQNGAFNLLDHGVHVGPVARVALLHGDEREVLDDRAGIECELSEPSSVVSSERV